MIVWPAKESIREHLPEIFLKSGYGKCRVRVIIDCGEVFIERPNHYLLKLLHGQTTSIKTHLNFWLELHPLGLFRSSLFVIGDYQVTNL